MRLLPIIILMSLTGCAALPGDPVRDCSVFRDVGGKSTPVGLIRLDPELSLALRQQLPESEREHYVCWYTSGNRLIVAGRMNPNTFIEGYPFIKEDGKWVLDDDIPFLLAVPRAID